MTIIETILYGIFIGFGSAIGSYLGTKLAQVAIERQFLEFKKLLEKWYKEIKKSENK